MFQWKTSNETRFMPRLFADIAKYCKKSEFTDDKMSTLLGIYHYTHLYNRSSRIISFEEVYHFFKELIVRHSVFVRKSLELMIIYTINIFFLSTYF